MSCEEVRPEFTKVIFEDTIYTNDILQESIRQLAKTLKSNPFHNNSPFIYLYAENHIKTVVAYFAILEAEFSVVLVDPDWRILELEHMMSDTPPFAIIKFSTEFNNLDFSHDIEFLPQNNDVEILQKRGYTIVYTNADDGYAKGALLSKKNIFTNAIALASINKANESTPVCALLPLSHMFGLTTGIFSPILSKSPIHLVNLNRLIRMDEIVKELIKYNVHYLYSVPVIYYLIGNDENAKSLLKNFILLTSGGYKLPEMIYNNFKQKFNIEIHEGYGLTEASPICSWHGPNDIIDISSVGKTFPYCQIKVIDTAGNDLPEGEIGEICVKGDHVMEGYYNKPQTNKQYFDKGWFKTGDLGKLQNGYVHLTGISKNMISVGGKNVYLSEIFLFLIKKFKFIELEFDVQKSTLIGDKLIACVKTESDHSNLQNTISTWASSHIAAYKLPKKWKFTI